MNDDDPRILFGRLLKASRLQADMTQEVLAERVETTQKHISRTENGLVNLPIMSCVEFAAGTGKRLVFTFEPIEPDEPGFWLW